MSHLSHAQMLAGPPERRPFLRRFMPAVAWLPRYRRAWLTGDVLAALTVWALLVPEGLAYAGIAGVPPQYGLYCAPLALAAYALFGGSRHLIVGPSSTVAIVSASVVAPLAAASSQHYLALTIAVALLAGAILVGAGLARLGFVAKFLAKPVLGGFIMGLAFTIAIGQAGKLVGVHLSGETALDKVVSLLSQAGDWTMLPLAVGGGSLVLLLLLERFVPKLPAAILAAVLCTLLAYALDLGAHGLDIVGEVPAGLPGWQLTGVGLEDLYHLLPGACAVALVGFAESIAIAKEEAARLDYEIDADQEMIAAGMADLGAGLLQGFAVNGSLSKSAANEGAGGRTQVVSLVCAALTLATVLFLTGLFTYLPEATLAAIVITALRKYFSPAAMLRLNRLRRADFVLHATALAGVFLFGVLAGIVIGVVLSLGLLVRGASSPNSVVLARDPEGGDFADVVSHPDYELVPGVLIYRFDGPLVFPNAERFVEEVRSLVKAGLPVGDGTDGVGPEGTNGEGGPGGANGASGEGDSSDDGNLGDSGSPRRPVTTVVIDFEAIADVDTTAGDLFGTLIEGLHKAGVRVLLARVHGSVRDYMEKAGLLAKLGAGSIYPRVLDAVESVSPRTWTTSSL